MSDTPLTETRVMEPGDDGHSGIVTADFARDLERVALQMAEALLTGDHQQERALDAWRVFKEKYK